ncbi:hypothetical protein GOP47_0013760 [Adiantum capillus-veneris]|uniref:Uncharacterized protein n=1 Tax=Adiantum capillus-veneris TaxID=13818 RepID=A0A9D4UP49_ADICA|nr:hypothetical protein GOP47_0013760 [Adiantum capillus-veneris]
MASFPLYVAHRIRARSPFRSHPVANEKILQECWVFISRRKRGCIALEYFDRTVSIRIMPVGIHMERRMGTPEVAETKAKICELKVQLNGKTVILRMDDLDIFQGINLKLLAVEQLLMQNPSWRRKLVLVQVPNPANGHETFEIQVEIYAA